MTGLPVEVSQGSKRLLRARSSSLGQEGRASRHVTRAAHTLQQHHAVPVLAEGVLLLRRLLEPAAGGSQVLRHALAVEVRLAEGSLGPAFATFSGFAEPGPGGGALGRAYETTVATGSICLVVVRKGTGVSLP